MKYPKLRTVDASRQIVEAFGGYNHNLRISDSEFYDMQNMCSDHFPVLSPRAKRGQYKACTEPEAMLYKDELFYIDSGCVYHEDGFFDLILRERPEGRDMISMGAYVVILPEGYWFNSAFFAEGSVEIPEDKLGTCDATWEQNENVATFQACQANGEIYEGKTTTQDTAPEDPEQGDIWIDTSGEAPCRKVWMESGDTGIWQMITTDYVRIDATGIGIDFGQYDGVEIAGLQDEALTALNGSNVIWAKGDDYIVVRGFLETKVTEEADFSVSRTMPRMDFVVECGNRLWGCRYGENAKGEFVNEIYCSKLGDFKNWSCFMGISTDSAAIQLGSDGPFTGAVSYMGNPIFFKENVLHKVYVSASGAHSVVDTACQGVQAGCGKSLAIVGDMLFYKSRSGVMAYDGSIPVALQSVFGSERYDNAVAGAHADKYYLSMRRSDGSHHLFVYDTRKGLWHREDDLQVVDFASSQDKLYAITGTEIRILAGAEEADEDTVHWYVQTGDIGISTPDRKYLSRLNVRMVLADDAEAAIYVLYDFEEEWRHLCSVSGIRMRSVDIPVRPMRCDHLRLRIEGSGEAKIYSITKTIEEGSDGP